MSSANTMREVAAAEKIAFFNATLTAQPSGASQAVVAQTQTSLTHAFGTADLTVADVGGAFSQGTLNDNFKEITTELALIKTDVANLVTLTNALRSALVTIGLIKGSA